MPNDVADWRTSAGNWYDRNPSVIATLSSSSLAQAPAGDTVLQTYTVPSSRLAFITAVILHIHRLTAAAPSGQLRLYVKNTQANYELRDFNNVVDTFTRQAWGAMGLNLAGAVLTVRYSDAGTGGTVDYYYNADIVEFDA